MIAEVIVDVVNQNVDKYFDYIIPSALELNVGDRVLLPFANRNIQGYVLNIKQNSYLSEGKLKTIIKKLDVKPILTKEMIGMCFFMKDKYHLRLIDCIRLMIPTVLREGKNKQLIDKQIVLNNNESFVSGYVKNLRANSTKTLSAINYLKNVGSDGNVKLNKMFSSAVINKLIKAGIVSLKENIQNRVKYDEIVNNKKIVLTKMQQSAIDTINQTINTVLLFGVTGSGKTEVYIRCLQTVLAQNKTAIMLVPEISLTPQVVNQFVSRFGKNIAVIHSGLNVQEKYDEWQRIKNGEAKIVVGARSAIFAPISNLGLIIIDEEHDGSYFSENNPRYYTHDVAQFRSEYNSCPLVLGSATPGIETFYKAKNKEYKLVELPVRVNNKEMPQIQIVDMSAEYRLGNASALSSVLLEKLEIVIKNKQQAILFINRRGFSSFVMCQKCGYIPKCTSCDVSLVYHKEDNALICHYCGKKFKKITSCIECGGRDLKLGGVGTQRVCEELKQLFPGVPVMRMDNDTTQTKNAHATILKNFSKSKPAILVGTQMVAKGHDFPEVSLVGILDADLSLFFNDFRACEKTFQLITQVAGRAGRDKIEGNVILQTFFPKHYVYNLAANYDYLRFYEKEINLRQATAFPPFSKIVRILVTSERDAIAKDTVHKLFMDLKTLKIKYGENLYFLEGMASTIKKINKKYRYQILLRFNINIEHDILNDIFGYVNILNLKDVTCFIEINPQSF